MNAARTTRRFVAYYRVSTDRQGRSGLGLEAQLKAVRDYLNGGAWEIAGEFIEVESGKRSDRPQLAKALEACRRHKARLVIAKLDRLSRNLAFIATLMESGVEFVAVDNPHATKLTIHILAAVAEHEREMISERTKAALAAAKARGTRLGTPDPKGAVERMGVALKARTSQFAANVVPIIRVDRRTLTSPAGISFQGGGRLEIVDCIIRDFAEGGISVGATSALAVIISNTSVTDVNGGCCSAGIQLLTFGNVPNSPITAALDQVRVNHSSYGVVLVGEGTGSPIQALISNSHIDNNVGIGVLVETSSSTNPVGAVLKNVTVNQTPTGISVDSASAVAFLSGVTQTTSAGFSSTGLDLENGGVAFSDGTNHFMGGHGTLQTWASQ